MSVKGAVKENNPEEMPKMLINNFEETHKFGINNLEEMHTLRYEHNIFVSSTGFIRLRPSQL